MIRPWIYILIVLLGVFLKFYKIDYRYFWFDEVETIIHTSGTNYNNKLPVNELKNISYYHDLLDLNKQNISIKSQLKGIWNSTNLNPLHYGILVFWHRIVGDKDIHYRYFNVIIFLLTLPFLFKLSEFLFKSKLAGWIAISLFSVNPFFQYYTFEARYNILCAFLIIINHYTFLKAINRKNHKWWTGYILSGICCWYSSFNLGLIFIGHFIYLLIFERKVFVPYIISSFIIFIAYLPWLISIYNNLNEISISLAWHGSFGNQNFFKLIFAQLYFVAYAFVVINVYSPQIAIFMANRLEGNYIQFIANLLVIALLIFSAIYTYKKGKNKVFIFILLIIIPQSLFFLITDLIRNTGISLIMRYNIIIIIGFMLFLIFLFKEKFTWGSYTFEVFFFGIVVLGIISGFYLANNNLINRLDKDMNNALFLSKYDKPLLISDMNTVYMPGSVPGILAFTNACKSDKIDFLLVSPDIQNISDYYDSNNYSNIFVLHGSQELINNLKLQLGDKMDSLEIKGMTNEWQIIYNKKNKEIKK
jgi:uncharacterized membrane protein